jgi:alpha-L-glutamate ligase-like protein
MIKRLKEKGILGINMRNAEYIFKYNPRRLFPLVDDKLLTKQLAKNNGIAVPQLYGVLEIVGQVRDLQELLEQHTAFVVKPAHGSGGQGILVVSERLNGSFRKQDGFLITVDELNYHTFNILSGLYSLGGQPDMAMIEYKVIFDPIFESVSYQGVPDIRIIVFLGVPVMSMVRLPTRRSNGKANLHQGAIGAGIDLGTGTTLSGVMGNDIVTEHPETLKSFAGLQIPCWNDLLQLASRCYNLTGLGYLGVDIVLDKVQGPLLLELNARPGLNIQIANMAGLLPRLNLVEEEHETLSSVQDRVGFAKDNFAM